MLVLKILAKDLHKHTHSTSIFLRISPKIDIKNQPHSLWICKLEKIHRFFSNIWTIWKILEKINSNLPPFFFPPWFPCHSCPQGEGTDEVHRFRLPRRPGPRGQPGTAGDQLLGRLEDEDAALCLGWGWGWVVLSLWI